MLLAFSLIEEVTMENINIDTKKIRECGQDIMNLSVELNEIITLLFNHINTLSSKTGEWQGSSATKFIEYAGVDKIQYLKMKEAIYQSGKYLTTYADSMERVINEVKR